MSDGSATLYFLAPRTLKGIGQVDAYDKEKVPVTMLNELEFINGHVYANIWCKEMITIIDPGSGRVAGLPMV